MSETASTVKLDDSGSADSVVARSAYILLLFAIIPYRPTIYLLCSLCFILVLRRISKDPAHRPINYYSSTSLTSVKILFLQGYTIFAVDNLQWYIQVSYSLHLNFVAACKLRYFGILVILLHFQFS